MAQRLVVLVCAVVVGVTLTGCGSGAPAYSPATMEEAWANHLEAFLARDLNKIMLDYDESSVLVQFNQHCSEYDDAKTESAAFQENKGLAAIRAYFTSLFAKLGDDNAVLYLPSGWNNGTDMLPNPVVEPEGDVTAASNVFLVWSAKSQGIEEATDTFSWNSNFKVNTQNIVVVDTGDTCDGAQFRSDDMRTQDATKVEAGWKNHFDAFGAKDVTKILLDYTEDSVIRIYDWKMGFSEHKGLTAIGAMFTKLFAAITANGDGVGVPVAGLKVKGADKNVFLVWKSNNNPRATDTFLFDDNGKIVRQNIVTTSVYAPATMEAAWANHLDAFLGRNVDKIIQDYDESSVLIQFNDHCSQYDDALTTSAAYQEHKGTEAIRAYFTGLFEKLTLDNAVLDLPSGWTDGTNDVSNPVVEPAGAVTDASNVFLVWSAPDQKIPRATDTFMWTSDRKVKKQNIVVTDTSDSCTAVFKSRSDEEMRTQDAAKVEAGWKNHFDAFGAKDVTKILLDYTENSIVRVFDWTTRDDAAKKGYTEFKGLAAIETMFTDLFKAITDAGDGVGVPVEGLKVEGDIKSVFLVWKANSNPLATDTFLFDAEGKIVRQNIVTTTKVSGGEMTMI